MSNPTLEPPQPPRFGARVLLRFLIPLAAAALVLRWPLEVVVQLILRTVTPFEGDAIDGPFQLFNAMRRLDAGQTPGVDFQYFHGLGLVYLHYPLFAWLGRDILASELSRDILSPAVYALAALAFGVAATRSFRGAWVAAALILVLSDLAAPDLLRHDVNPRSLRSSLPIFGFAVMLSHIAPLRKAALLGCIAAAAVSVGAEHAIALIGATVVVQGFVLLGHWRTATRADWLFVPAFLLTAAAAVSVIYLALGQGVAGAIGALRYALIEVPRDQFWYFGTPPNPFVGEWSDLLRAPRSHTALIIGIPFALWALERSVRCPRRSLQGDPPVVVATMLIYSLVACIGYLGIAGDQYLAHVFRTFAMAGALLVADAWRRRDGARTLGDYLSTRPLLRTGAIAACIVGVISNARIVRLGYKDLQRSAITVGPLWQNTVRALREGMGGATSEAQRTIWSTYAGMFEAHLGIFPSHEDYIIHALGPERRRDYLRKFREARPQFVQTIDRSYTRFEEWLQNTSWDFYEDVLNNYRIAANTAHSLLWARTDAPWREPSDDWTRVPLGGDGEYTLPFVGDDRYPAPILVVQVTYAIENVWVRVPILGATPRCLIRVKDASSTIPVCVPPYETAVRFPVVPRPGSAPRIASEVRSLVPGVRFEIKAVEFRMRDLPPGDALFIKHLPPWTPPTDDGPGEG